MNYLADVGALARKDLRLELRTRDTLPAMVLFVVSTLVVFHFALPAGADETGAEDVAAYGLLWVALVFTALLGLARAWAPERESGVLDGLVLAPCDRSAIWLGKSAAVFVFLAAIELVALPAFALFFSPLDAGAVLGVLLANIGICAVGTLLAAMAATAYVLVRGVIAMASGKDVTGEQQQAWMRKRVLFQAVAIVLVAVILILASASKG